MTAHEAVYEKPMRLNIKINVALQLVSLMIHCMSLLIITLHICQMAQLSNVSGMNVEDAARKVMELCVFVSLALLFLGVAF